MAVPDISAEVAAFRDAAYGEEVRGALISLANKLRGVITSELSDMSTTWNNYKDDVDGTISDLNTAWDNYKDDIERDWDDYKDDVADITKESTSIIGIHQSTIGDWIKGYYINSSGVITEKQDRWMTHLLPCAPKHKLEYVAETDNNVVSGLTFYDLQLNVVQTNVNVGTIGEPQTVTVPVDAYFVRLVFNPNKMSVDQIYIKDISPLIDRYSVSGLSSILSDMSINVPGLRNSMLSLSTNNQDIDDWYTYYTPTAYVSSPSYIRSDNYIIDDEQYVKTWRYIPEVFNVREIEISVEDGYTVNTRIYTKNNETNNRTYNIIGPTNGYVSPINANQMYLKDFIYCAISVKKTDGSIIDRDCPIKIKKRRTLLSISNLKTITQSIHITNFCKRMNSWTNNTVGDYVLFYQTSSTSDTQKHTYSCPIAFSPYDKISFDNSVFKILIIFADKDDKIVATYTNFFNDVQTFRAIDISPTKSSLADRVYYSLRIRNDYTWDDENPPEVAINVTYANAFGSGSDINEAIVAYVSPDGSDSNSGSYTKPFKTVNAAIDSGARVISLMPGIYTDQINISTEKDLTIIPAVSNERVIFMDPNAVAVTSDTMLSGYNNIHVASVTGVPTSNMNWIHQDGIPDETTLISNDDRHPSQRGQYYRCLQTAIEKTTATTLQDALTEIETSTTYKWFFDGTTLYYSCPHEVSEDYPICFGRNRNLFAYNTRRCGKLEVYGIEAKYQCINAMYGAGFKFVDCKVSCARGAGGFRWDQSVGVEFIRCEAQRSDNGSTGDGFNGHASTDGDPLSKQCTCTLIDCWSHDNLDDGYSDHERGEITVIGGLYEYNRKAGVTPSTGSHCRCYNVTSRHNYRGFYYCNSTAQAEGGNGGQMSCMGCLAEYNTVGAGFEVANGSSERSNSMLLVDCISNFNKYGFAIANHCFGKMINCRETGSVVSVWDSEDSKSRCTIINPSLVE